MNRLARWAGRKVMKKMLARLMAGMKESAGKTSERTAIVAAVVVKLAMLYAPAATVLNQAAGYLDMTPDAFVGMAITYALLRFRSKVAKAEAVPAGPATEEKL